MILGGGKLIRARDLRFEAPPGSLAAPLSPPAGQDTLLQENMTSVEGRLIVDALARAGTRQKAAANLGISPRTLRYKIARLRSLGFSIPRCREPLRGNQTA